MMHAAVFIGILAVGWAVFGLVPKRRPAHQQLMPKRRPVPRRRASW